MARITFIREYKLSIATVDGPGERVFAEGETVDMDPAYAVAFLAGGFAVKADEPAVKPLNRRSKAEVIDYATEVGIDTDGMTKAEILEALEAAVTTEVTIDPE